MVQNRHGAEHVSLSYKLMYWVLAAAAAGIAPTSGIRIGHLIGRDRHGIDSADQLGSLRLLIGGEESVLSRLRSLELQALVFSRQSSDLVLGQEVQDRAAVGIGVVDDVAGAGLDGVAGIASLGSHVIADTVNAPLSIAAALRQLGAEGVKARLRLIAQVAHSGIHAMEAVAHGIPDGGLAVLETVQGEALVDVRAGSKALEAGVVDPTAATEAAISAIAPAKDAPDKEQNDPAGPIAAPAAETAVSALVGGSHGHSHHSAVRRKTHCVISFVVLFQIPAGNLIL